jgi:hypothetical protein
MVKRIHVFGFDAHLPFAAAITNECLAIPVEAVSLSISLYRFHMTTLAAIHPFVPLSEDCARAE